MKREYTEEEKTTIIQKLGINLLNGMLSGGQAAQVLSRRAEIEIGRVHKYREGTIRQHVKNGRLEIAQKVHDRLNLFKIDDVFALPLSPTRWRSGMPSKGKHRKKTKTHART